MHSINTSIPLLGFAAFSGTGKTSLLKDVIPLLKHAGINIGMIKHAHHEFDIDHPGKDSFELRKAGADSMLIASSQRWALIVETPAQQDAQLSDLINTLSRQHPDLILVEGFRHVAFPKIELHRPVLAHPYLFVQDPSIIALATDGPPPPDLPIPLLDLNNPQQISAFILKEIMNQPR